MKTQIQAYLVACVQNLKRFAGTAPGGIFDLIENWLENVWIAVQGKRCIRPTT